MVIIALIIVLFFGAPVWTACLISPRLAWLTNPAVRIALAITPQDSRVFLWEKLGSRIYWSFLPGILALFRPVRMALDNLQSHFLSSERASVTFSLFEICQHFTMCTWVLLEGLVAITVAFTMARRSCEQGRQMNPWACGLKSAVLACGMSIVWGLGSSFLVQLTSRRDALPAIFALTCLVFAIPVFLVGQEWKKFVSVYLDVDPVPPPSAD